MNTITLTQKQQLLLTAKRVKKNSKRNTPEMVAKFILAVEGRS